MIVIVDYGMGNLRSVEKAFQKTGADVMVSNRPADVLNATSVVLPGVGAFRDCIGNLETLGLASAIKESISIGKPFLGICLGMQILFEESEEFGLHKGLGIFKGNVPKFISTTLKIPHMGWNKVTLRKKIPLFDGIEDGQYFYFVHSYYVAPVDDEIIAGTTEYGGTFTSMIAKDNVYALQFHPEKSQKIGLKIIENFVKIA
ncbi:MAG: imidazole glycerol phosphate synthase subunit HisH [Nitrospirae bacterium]|nr:imidazole glycerol phosphate synthase subunit HisH [Nitrospirota bacterium]